MKKYCLLLIIILIVNLSKVIAIDLYKYYPYFISFLKGYGQTGDCVNILEGEKKDAILSAFTEILEGRVENPSIYLIRELSLATAMELSNRCKLLELMDIKKDLENPEVVKNKLELLGQLLSNKNIIDWTVN